MEEFARYLNVSGVTERPSNYGMDPPAAGGCGAGTRTRSPAAGYAGR